MKAKLLISIACGVALICASAAAQPPMGGGGFPGGGRPPGGMPGGGFPGGGGFNMSYAGGVVDMTALANYQAERMGRELGLTPQQVKKIAKLNKKELDRRMNHMHSVGVPRMGGMPGMGGPGMGGGRPGGPGMGGGRPGGPGMGGGRPGGFPGGGFPGMMPDSTAAAAPTIDLPPEAANNPDLQQGLVAMSRLEALEETQADIKARIKIEKKMKKILTEEQYARWSARRDGRHNFMLRPEAEFDLDNIPEELREQFMERIRRGRYHEQNTNPEQGQAPAPFIPQM